MRKNQGMNASKVDVLGEHPYNLQRALERFERGHIRNILELTRWDRPKTSEMLGISPQTLAEKIRCYRLSSGSDP